MSRGALPHRSCALRAWAPHLALSLAAIALVALQRARHLGTEDAYRTALDVSAPAKVRISAMHRWANRLEERQSERARALTAAFLGADDELLREAALLVDLCRHGPADPRPEPQTGYVASLGAGGTWTAHRLRATIFHLRKSGGPAVGTLNRLSLDEARWVAELGAGRPLPSAAVLDAHFAARAERNRRIAERAQAAGD